MIKEYIEAWEQNKDKLENYFRNTKQEEYDRYKKIVEKLIELVIFDEKDCGVRNLDVSKMTMIDDGDYQGTQIYIIPFDTYQPDIEEYVYTNNYYGSCSGCDTLLSICRYEDELPTEEQIKDYMTLALHLLQKFRRFTDDIQSK